jgi:proline dehydrogenase
VVNLSKRIEAENHELRSLLNLAKHTEIAMSRKLAQYKRIIKKLQDQQNQQVRTKACRSPFH